MEIKFRGRRGTLNSRERAKASLWTLAERRMDCLHLSYCRCITIASDSIHHYGG
jgi:hypothetical protein